MMQRLALFAARGVGVDDAALLADRLLVRDRENERVGCCAECHRLVGNAPGRGEFGCSVRSPAIAPLLQPGDSTMNTSKTKTPKGRPPAIKPKNPGAFELQASTPEEKIRIGADLCTSGGINAALVHRYMPIEDVGVPAIHAAMVRQAEALLTDGDRIHQAEAMLLNQAVALQAMFIDLASRAKLQTHRDYVQTLTGLALRAQTNCTQTLKTLGELRSTRQAVFAKQANIAHGHQQVNNGQQPVTVEKPLSGAHEGPFMQNELLEANDGKWLDTGATGSASGADSNMETVGTVDRSDHT